MARNTFKMAAIQAASVLFDKDASTEKACGLIRDAGKEGADIAAFGETWLPGYPFFVESAVQDLTWEASAVYLDNAIVLGGAETDALCDAASEAGCDVVIGVAEKDPHTEGTAYCTALTISREGYIIGRHRKLKPTHAERIIWGDGDGAGLRVHDREYGRISALNCWEHQMMLPGYALAAQGTQIHSALWPGWEKTPAPGEYCWARQHLLSRSFASQAATYVICAAGVRHAEHIPDRWKPFGLWEHSGHSTIIDPRGEIIAEPIEGEGIVYATGSHDVIRAAKAACDIAGHYARPDVFQFEVDDRARGPGVTFSSDSPAGDGRFNADLSDDADLSDEDWEAAFADS